MYKTGGMLHFMLKYHKNTNFFCSNEFVGTYLQKNDKANNKYSVVVAYKLFGVAVMSLLYV